MTGRARLGRTLRTSLMGLERHRRAVENAVIAGQLTESTARIIYEGLFLHAVTSFESFIENLFVGLLVTGGGVAPWRTDITPRIVVRSHAIARELTWGFGHQRYATWLPYDGTVKRAKVLFRGGRPFSSLDEADERWIRRSVTIRNAIAHKSRESLRKFDCNVIGVRSIRPSERKPGAFLRGVYRTQPTETRYEVYVAELQAVATKLMA